MIDLVDADECGGIREKPYVSPMRTTPMSQIAVKPISWRREVHERQWGDAVRTDVYLFGRTPIGTFIIKADDSSLDAEIRSSPLGQLPRRVFDGPGSEQSAVEFVNEWYVANILECLTVVEVTR